MSKNTIRMLAVSTLALGAAFIGHNQASAFSFAPTFFLAQASGGASGGASGSGGSTLPGAGGGAGASGGVGASGGAGASGSGGASGSAGSPTAPSPSMGVKPQCANIANASERAACMKR